MAMAVDSCAMSCESVNTSLITMTAAVGDVSLEDESFCRNRDSQPIQAYQQDHPPNKTVVKFDFAFRFPKLQTKNERKKQFDNYCNRHAMPSQRRCSLFCKGTRTKAYAKSIGVLTKSLTCHNSQSDNKTALEKSKQVRARALVYARAATCVCERANIRERKHSMQY
jgi:hypothetical protein